MKMIFDRSIIPRLPKFEVYEKDGSTPYDGRYGAVLGISPDGMLINECACLPKGKFIVEFENGEKYRW
jgi:hypothetical protein